MSAHDNEMTQQATPKAPRQRTERMRFISDHVRSTELDGLTAETDSVSRHDRTLATPILVPTKAMAVRLVPKYVKFWLWREVAQGFEHIEVEPTVMGGEPVIAGTRIPVYLIVTRVGEGRSVEEVVRDFDGELTSSDVREAMRFVSALAR